MFHYGECFFKINQTYHSNDRLSAFSQGTPEKLLSYFLIRIIDLGFWYHAVMIFYEISCVESSRSFLYVTIIKLKMNIFNQLIEFQMIIVYSNSFYLCLWEEKICILLNLFHIWWNFIFNTIIIEIFIIKIIKIFDIYQ